MSPALRLDNDTAIAAPEDASEGGSEARTSHQVTALIVGTGFAALLVIVILVIFVYRRKMGQNSRKPDERVIHNPHKPAVTTVPVFVTPACQRQSRHLFSRPQERPISHSPLLPPPAKSISPSSSASTSDSEESGQSSRIYSRTSPSSKRSLGRMGRREKGLSDLRGSSSAPSSPRPFNFSPLVPSFHRSPYGRVLFMASYDAQERAFQVTVISAAGLPEIIPGKGCNSFVKVYLAPDEDYRQRRTQAVKHSRYPRFDSTFTFKGMEMGDLIQRTLVMHICHQADHGITHRNSLIGIASVGIDTIQSEILRRDPTWIYLTNGKVTSDVLQNTELEVTLCLSSEAKSLTVLVNKVVKIPSKDATAVYVSYQVCCNHRTVYKTRTTKVTSTQPVFHHQKNFDITDLNLEDIELQFQVKSKKALKKRKIVGEAVIGPHASSHSGRDHWTDILDRQERQVSKCHRLTLYQEEDLQSAPDVAY